MKNEIQIHPLKTVSIIKRYFITLVQFYQSLHKVLEGPGEQLTHQGKVPTQ